MRIYRCFAFSTLVQPNLFFDGEHVRLVCRTLFQSLLDLAKDISCKKLLNRRICVNLSTITRSKFHQCRFWVFKTDSYKLRSSQNKEASKSHGLITSPKMSTVTSILPYWFARFLKIWSREHFGSESFNILGRFQASYLYYLYSVE